MAASVKNKGKFNSCILSYRDADSLPHFVVVRQFVRSKKVEKNFSDRLKELRGDLSQDAFALKIGTKQTTLSNWERGFREPNFSGLILISTSCGVSADWLLGLSDERSPGRSSLSDSRIALLEKKIIQLESANDALQKALAIVGGHRAQPAKTGGSSATKTA